MEGEPAPQQRTVYGKIVRVMASLERLPKDKTNAHFGYAYTSEAAVKAALRPLCAEHGLVILPSVSRHERDAGLTTLWLDISFVDSDNGDAHTIHMVSEGLDQQDKGPAKALTLGLKYVLLNTFLVDTGEDPDAAGRQESQGRTGGGTRRAPANGTAAGPRSGAAQQPAAERSGAAQPPQAPPPGVDPETGEKRAAATPPPAAANGQPASTPPRSAPPPATPPRSAPPANGAVAAPVSVAQRGFLTRLLKDSDATDREIASIFAVVTGRSAMKAIDILKAGAGGTEDVLRLLGLLREPGEDDAGPVASEAEAHNDGEPVPF